MPKNIYEKAFEEGRKAGYEYIEEMIKFAKGQLPEPPEPIIKKENIVITGNARTDGFAFGFMSIVAYAFKQSLSLFP